MTASVCHLMSSTIRFKLPTSTWKNVQRIGILHIRFAISEILLNFGTAMKKSSDKNCFIRQEVKKIKDEKTVESNVTIIPGEFTTKLRLPFAPIKAGFPSPAEAYEVDSLDFNHDLVPHPDTTFYAHVHGDSMKDAGINDGDMVVVDRSAEAKKGDIVIAFINHEYTMKYFDDTHKAEGYVELIPANKDFPVFKVTKDDELTIWGVVQYAIKKFIS